MTGPHGEESGANAAAWLVGYRQPLDVRPAADPGPPTGRHLVVRARAVAVNPVDWIVRAAGRVVYPWLRPPAVLGTDVAGEVVAVGPDVTRLAVGDRVLGLAIGTEKDVADAAQGAFQRLVVLREDLVTPLPEVVSYDEAATLPLAVATASSGLFQERNLGLERPSPAPPSRDETVLVWGGSTSVGAAAVQLARGAGYRVVSTASPRNAAFVAGLGAAEVFDYRDPDVVRRIIGSARGRRLAGALALGQGSTGPCVRIVQALGGPRVVAVASTPVSFASVARPGSSALRLAGILARMGPAMALGLASARRRGVRTPMIWGSSLKDDGLGEAIFAEWLPGALASGAFVPAPPARVVGEGLDAVEAGLVAQAAGVSAEKIVVRLRPVLP